MKVLRLAVVCCLISMFASLPFQAESAERAGGRCAIANLKAEQANARAIFTGKVTKVVEKGDVKTFTFVVAKRWKGAAGKTVEVSVQQTMRYQAWFEVGGEYLVFARSDGASDTLWEQRCSRTKRLADASEDIRGLGKAQKPDKK